MALELENFKSRNLLENIKTARKLDMSQKAAVRNFAHGDFGLAVKDTAAPGMIYSFLALKADQLQNDLAILNAALASPEATIQEKIEIMAIKHGVLNELSKVSEDFHRFLNSPSGGNGERPAHSFGPREVIGPTAAVQVNINHDVNRSEIRTGAVESEHPIASQCDERRDGRPDGHGTPGERP